jgi:enterochelin esterase-like enzyme
MAFGTLFLLGLTALTAVPPSPRIESLKKTIAVQQVSAVQAFWAEVSKGGGTPLIECPANLAPNCLVTLLWRGDASTRNVVVRAEALPGAPAEHLFDHLPDTDVWYRTYQFRDDARFMYMLSINDPLTSWDVEGPERKTRYAGVRLDPLNQRSECCYVSLPRAPSERWIEERPGVAHGEIRSHKLPSAALSGERSIEVYATPGFRSGNGVKPILILFDGVEARERGKAPIILDNLFAERRIPPMLAVFLQQPYERRETDLQCSKATNLFLVDELMPWLRKEYKIRTAAGRTIAAGASLGGLAAAYAALSHPEAIGRVLSQSGSFWWGKTDSEPEWLTAEFSSKPRVKAKFYLDVGLMETNGGAISQLETNRRLRNVLRMKGYDVIYREFNGTHAFPCWRAGFAEALVALPAD